jgi:hypothetical protein
MDETFRTWARNLHPREAHEVYHSAASIVRTAVTGGIAAGERGGVVPRQEGRRDAREFCPLASSPGMSKANPLAG